MVGRDSTDWLPTAFRTHTLGNIVDSGADLIGQEVTVAGHAEISRGRGGVCFLTLRDGTGHLQIFLKKDAMDEQIFLSIQSLSRESTVQITGEVAQKRPPKVPEGEPLPPPEYEIFAKSATILSESQTPLPVG